MSALLTAGVLTAPMVAGLFLSALLLRRPLPTTGVAVYGYALLLGPMLATLVFRLQDGLGIDLGPAPFFLLATCLASLLAMLWWRDRPRVVAETTAVPDSWTTLPWPGRVAGGCLLLLILLHLILPAVEAFLRPLYGWDATMHWATKARVWFDQGRLVPFVDNQVWLRQAPGSLVFTDTHPAYPPTIPLLQLWMSVAFQRFSDTLINLPWPVLQTALVLIFFGESRRAGAPLLTAMVFTYLLVSLPLLNTHTALAGYADFPLGVCVLGALISLVAGLQARDPRRLVLALFLACMATQLKNEGFFWALALSPAALVCSLPRRTAYGVLVFLGVAVLLVLLLLPTHVEVAGHSLESLQLGYREGAASALMVQFATDVWHGFIVLLLLALAGFALRGGRDERMAAIGVFILASLALYVFLFTYTRFSYGAYNVTACARIALHLVPSVMFLALLSWHGLRAAHPDSR